MAHVRSLISVHFTSNLRTPPVIIHYLNFLSVTALFLSLCSVLVAQEKTILFRDVAQEQRLNFKHYSPFTPQRHLHLTMGSGIGWLDYDLDGRSDLYLAQGSRWTGDRFKPELTRSDELFRNLGGRFQEAAQAGIQNFSYGMGIAVGDYDNDGFADLYITNFGKNKFFYNNGDGTFSEMTGNAVLNDPGYGASATWVDIEPDGDLDLFVTNYLQIDDSNYVLCEASEDQNRVAIGCPPWRYHGQQDLYFENQGNGQFLEQTEKVGLISTEPLAGLGVIAADLNDDGFTDLFVANDSNVNQFWQNSGQGTFIEMGLPSGLAINREGEREAGMGVAIADVDHSGQFDLFLTHYYQETNTLYKNLGGLFFLDVTDEFGMAGPSRSKLSFGIILADFSGDGFADCFIANGHIHDQLDKINRHVPFEQSQQVLLNDQGKRFLDLSQSAGNYFKSKFVGRGAATADFNNDGRLDIAVQHLNGSVALIENETSNFGESFSIKLIGTIQARDPIGARLVIKTDQRQLYRIYEGSSSYLSSNERMVLVTLKPDEQLETISVTWTGGKTESWSDSDLLSRTVYLVQGQSHSQ